MKTKNEIIRDRYYRNAELIKQHWLKKPGWVICPNLRFNIEDIVDTGIINSVVIGVVEWNGEDNNSSDQYLVGLINNAAEVVYYANREIAPLLSEDLKFLDLHNISLAPKQGKYTNQRVEDWIYDET